MPVTTVEDLGHALPFLPVLAFPQHGTAAVKNHRDGPMMSLVPDDHDALSVYNVAGNILGVSLVSYNIIRVRKSTTSHTQFARARHTPR